ncbi:MAG: spermine/spermidine synthase domain-containing protein [Gammaproteobacteria bacterium]
MGDSKPGVSLLFAVGLVSAASLAYEVLLIRLLSIIQWHHFAYMIISLALLGYGASGAFLAIYREKLQTHFAIAMTVNMVAFGFSAPASFAAAQTIPFNPDEILWAPVQSLYLFGLYLLLAIPFFFAANVIGLSFYRYKNHIAAVYAWDLIGAGIGSAGIVVLLFMLFPEKILTLVGAMGVAAAILSVTGFSAFSVKTKIRTILTTVAVSAAVFAMSIRIEPNISPYKGESQLLRIPGTEVVDRRSGPLGLIDVVESRKTPLRHAPGLSLNTTDEPPDQLAVFTDADNMTAITRYDGQPGRLSYLDQTTSSLPYHLKALNRVLILGAGTGSDVLQALSRGVSAIDAVELNPQVVDLLENRYAEFSGGLYRRPGVNLHIGEARGFVAASRNRYDLIALSLLDAFGASSAGLYSLSENYLYTEEALQSYLRHLKPNGYLGITRWIKMPPRDTLKLLATAVAACKALHWDHPERRIALIRSWQTGTLVVKNGYFDHRELDDLKRFNEARSFDAAYYPGIDESQVNRFNILQQPYFYQAATALLSSPKDEAKRWLSAYKFNLEPATDDRPYFFHFFKWSSLPEILSLLGRGGMSLLESGYLLLLATLIQALFAGVLLILLPLRLGKKKLCRSGSSENRRRVLLYFLCLGLAFLFVEIAFIQKLILILHHPLYAVTTVLSVFLVAAGGGSLISEKLFRNRGHSAIVVVVTGIALLCLSYVFGLALLTPLLLQINLGMRLLCTVLIIAPLGFLMGMPFPLGLNSLGQKAAELIPWAWGINGCASVVSSVLATLIAMQFGFNALILCALLLYVGALFNFP